MKKIVLCFLMFLFAGSALYADAITFEATVDSPRVSMDQAVQLTLTFSGVDHDLDPINLPVLDGFTSKYMGPSTSISFEDVNGSSQSHSERSFIYDLFPNKTGHFQIPAISATINGQTYTTKPIDIEVSSSSAPAQAPASGDSTNQNQAPSTESLKDKVLIMVAVDKTDVYLNERIPLSIKLLVSGVPIRDIQYPNFDKTGFMVDNYEKPQQGSQEYNGVNYDTVEFKTNVYPGRLGDLDIGPVQIQGNIVYKTGQNNPFNQVNSIFGGDLFNNMFDTYATRPVTVNSQPIHMHVLPLPEDNRPNDFNGAIGQSFDFKASVAPLQVKAGDPLTLKMDVTGSGNFKSLKMPVFQASGFKTYEPQIKDLGNEKTAEEVIIPISAETKEVPALRFSYFDTSIKDYKTITQGPFAIQVTAPSADQEFKAVGFADVSREPSTQLVPQISLGSIVAHAYQSLLKLFGSLWFKLGSVLFLIAITAFILWRRFQDRLENDPAFARRLKAVREARQGLAQAEECITKGTPKYFYGLLTKVLHDYFANKWHQSSAALSTVEIVSRLKTAKLDDTHLAQIKNLLEQSDLVCFAGADRDAAQMRADLSQTQGLITHFEKSLK